MYKWYSERGKKLKEEARMLEATKVLSVITAKHICHLVEQNLTKSENSIAVVTGVTINTGEGNYFSPERMCIFKGNKGVVSKKDFQV